MITAIVIDDEVAVREGMLRHIRWKKLGINQVEAIESAEKAVEYLEENQPDIIISDIRLPKMDGIQLAELVREKQWDCRILFISAYTDLEYFRRAIRLSVEAYVEKPINIDRMEQELYKVVQKIAKDRKTRENEVLARDIIDLHTEQLANYVLKSLFRGRWNDALMVSFNQGEEYIRQEDYFLCMVVRVRKGSERIDSEKICAIMNQQFSAVRHLTCAWEPGVTVCLLAFTSSEYLKDVSKILEEVQTEFIVHKCREDLSISISERKKGWQNIAALYQQAVCQLQRLFFLGYGHLLRSEQDGTKIMEQERVPFRKFETALKERRKEEVLRLAAQIYEYLREQTDTLPTVVKNVFYQLTSMALHLSDNSPWNRGGAEDIENFTWFRFSNFETISECYSYLKETIENCFSNEEEFVYDNRAVNGAIRYIKDHFGNAALSVRDIAEEVKLTPQYMTYIFKQKTGVTVGQFIREVRMNYSQLLLKDSDLSLSEIAKLAGYVDENYWAKVYKKEHGQSPSEFRKGTGS